MKLKNGLNKSVIKIIKLHNKTLQIQLQGLLKVRNQINLFNDDKNNKFFYLYIISSNNIIFIIYKDDINNFYYFIHENFLLVLFFMKITKKIYSFLI